MNAAIAFRRALIFLLVVAGAPAQALEHILEFHSAIVVNTDASMEVTETIRVQAEGDRIRHGILRDFPTDYRDRYGNRVRVAFEPLSLEIDGDAGAGGAPPWRSEPYANGVRVYFGDANRLLSNGEHTFAFRYRTTRQLGFFADHDELYWNVTGNGWNFPIDHAGATVALPGAVTPDQLKLAAYTGVKGANGRAFSASADAPSHAHFATTAKLQAREGLTIVASFPKGVVTMPGFAQQAAWFFADNMHLLVGATGVLFAFLYLFAKWWRFGRDPRARVVMPQYEAPEGFTPAGLRFVEKRDYDDICFASDLVDVGVRGGIEIRRDGNLYTLRKTTNADLGALPLAEAKIRSALLDATDEIALAAENRDCIVGARLAHRSEIDRQCGGEKYFRMNRAALRPAMWTAVLALIAMNWMAGMAMHDARGQTIPVFVLIFPLLIILIAAGAALRLCVYIGNAWSRSAARGSHAGALLRTPFAAVGLLVCLAVCSLAGWFAGAPGMLLALATELLFLVFYFLLPAPTQAGRDLLDRIAGLRMYLGVAEREDLERMQCPQMNEREFQRFLPYALALDVAKTWTNRFAVAVGPAAAAAAFASWTWYQGSYDSASSFGDFGSNFSDDIGASLTNAISSSSFAPGSSSGSSDGGSSDNGGSSGGDSGGGGGGGGGDGW